MHVLRLTVELRRLGWDVEVAGPADSDVWPALQAEGVPLRPLPIRSEPGVADLPGTEDLRVARALRRLDRRMRYDIVHAHSSRAGGLVRAALPRRRRLIYTPNCFGFATGFSGARRLVYRALEQVLVPRTGRIVATCEWERAEAARLVGAVRRTEVIPNGVPSCGDAGRDPSLVAFKDDRPLAGMVATLRPQKDPLALVGATAAMAARGDPPGRVAIVGNGPLAGEVDAEIKRLALGDHIRRFAFEQPVETYLRVLDLFVLPSLWEAFPIASLEAMACGVPVLATRVGGVDEQVVDNVTGRVIPPADPAPLAAALEGALADRDRLRTWGEAARRRVLERYSIELVAEQTETLYRAAMTAG
jgi:glycosyltransferase involved in cell wall biosynthesis